MTSPLLALLHLCDSLFPLGGFAHSDGLEMATAFGRITDAGGLRQWMDACLEESLGRFEGPAVLLAWRLFTEHQSSNGNAPVWPALLGLDAEVHALRPAASGRQASRAMGTRLLKTWQQVRQPGEVAGLQTLLAAGDSGSESNPGPVQVTLPIAFGLVCASASVDEQATVEAFIYTRLAATISCAMRAMAIGQHEAHALLSSLLARVPAVAEAAIARGARPAAFMPAMDLAAMSHQYVHSRLFRS